eukprot:gene88-3694_t
MIGKLSSKAHAPAAAGSNARQRFVVKASSSEVEVMPSITFSREELEMGNPELPTTPTVKISVSKKSKPASSSISSSIVKSVAMPELVKPDMGAHRIEDCELLSVFGYKLCAAVFGCKLNLGALRMVVVYYWLAPLGLMADDDGYVQYSAVPTSEGDSQDTFWGSEATNGRAPGAGHGRQRKKTRIMRWLILHSSGEKRWLTMDKRQVIKAFGLDIPSRDMRLMDTHLVNYDTIGRLLVRDNALVISMEHVRMIIMADK